MKARRAFMERLRMAAESALDDVAKELEYDYQINPVTGAEERVSRISEVTRQKYNMGLLAMHPEVMQRNQLAGVKVEINADVIQLALRAQAETDKFIEQGRVIDGKLLAGPSGADVCDQGDDLGCARRSGLVVGDTGAGAGQG